MKVKCIICKAQNTQKEMGKHLTTTTVFNHKQKLDMIKNRQELESICEYHRNPLVFNTEVINLFQVWNKIHALTVELDTRGVL